MLREIGLIPFSRPQSHKFVRLEVSIYSLTRDERLWVGTTETYNPESLPELIADVSEAVREELLARKLIPEPAEGQ